MLGVSLLRNSHRRAETVWPEGLRSELRRAQQNELLHPGGWKVAPRRLTTMASSHSAVQQILGGELGVERRLAEGAANDTGLYRESLAQPPATRRLTAIRRSISSTPSLSLSVVHTTNSGFLADNPQQLLRCV